MARPSTHSQASAVPSAQPERDTIKFRSACNRCHQQKLRCIKAKEHTSCERCTKLKTDCRFSPRRRQASRYRHPGTDPGARLGSRGLAPAMAPAMPDMEPSVSWLPFPSVTMGDEEGLGHLDSDLIFPTPVDLAGMLATDPSQLGSLAEPLSLHALGYDGDGVTPHATHIHRHAEGQAGGNCSLDLLTPYQLLGHHNDLGGGMGGSFPCTTRRLTSLNMALYECASKLPSIKLGSVDVANGPCSMNHRARKTALLALDEVFNGTNEFINVMKDLLPTTGGHGIPTLTVTRATPNPLGHSLRALPEPVLEPEVSPPPIDPLPQFDEATRLLFLSCHCRLIEIYESIFQAMQRCIAGSREASHSTAGIILPQLQVGGLGGVSSPALRVDFEGPRLPPATISMYMVLITTTSAQLWTQVGEALRWGRGYRGSGNQASTVHAEEIVGPAWDVAMKKTDSMSRTIEVVQYLL
ncbi:hypothetical protein F5Y10DRAFT_229360 [Nemania abortiva]|nr:hypothetical protein F5Y10DRAFT_229360 [Nemania abortiva]